MGELAIAKAFGEVVEALGDKRDLDELLHLIADKVCVLLDVRRCSIHLRDPESGLFRGRVGHAGADIDARVKRTTSGLPADRFTQEVVESRQPVLLTDARSDPRAIRSAMREWNVRSALGVPMLLHGDVIGMIVIDDEGEPHEFSDSDQQLAAAFANLAAASITQAQLTGKLRSTLKTVARQNELLKQASAMEQQLTELVLRQSSLGELGEAVAGLLGKPCSIHDASFRCLTRNRPPGVPEEIAPRLLDERMRAVPEVDAMVRALDPGRQTIVGPFPSAGLQHRFLIAPVVLDDEWWGYLIVMEYGRRLSSLDEIIARRAAINIALELSAERRVAGTEWEAFELLAGALLRGDQEPDALRKRADLLGIALDVPRVLCHVCARGEATVPPARTLAERLADGDALAAPLDDGTAVLLATPAELAGKQASAWASEQLRGALDALAPAGELLAAISTVQQRPEAFAGKAVTEVRQVMRCMQGHLNGAGNHVLSADALGPGRLFLAATSAQEAHRFCADALGELLAPGDPKMRELLATLDAFLSNSRSVRRAAEALAVHENTIRYRIGRIEEITGLAVGGDGDAQLTAQLALLVLRLEGRLPALS